MKKFTKDSFDVIKITDIPKTSLLPDVLKQLDGREIYSDVDDDLDEKIYNGDIFETIAGELAEMEDSPLYPSQKVIDQIDNLAEIIETELVRIIAI